MRSKWLVPPFRKTSPFHFLEEVSPVLNVLYGKFLAERLGPAWEADALPAMNEWIEGKNESEPTGSSENEGE